MDWEPSGLVVVGGDWHFDSLEFDSHSQIPSRAIFTLIAVKVFR